MSAKTITITEPAEVQVPDVATFTSPSGTVIGTVMAIKPFVGGDNEGQPALFTVSAFGFQHDFHVDYFVSATHEMPMFDPGTTGTATVRGVKGLRVMRLQENDTDGLNGYAWVSADLINGKGKAINGYDGTFLHTEEDVTDFVPRAVAATPPPVEAVMTAIGATDAAADNVLTRDETREIAAAVLALLGGGQA